MNLRKILPLTLVALLAAGCSVAPTPLMLQPKSTIAAQEAGLYNLLFYMGLGVFLFVLTLLMIVVIRDRQRKGDTAEPRQVHGNTRLEVIWTAVPVAIVLFIFFMTVRTMNAVAAPEKSADTITVKVTGHRWWWEFEYPDNGGFKTANELHIPVGKSVLLEVTSADVIHSFWPPQLSGKMDVVPGQINKTWIHSDNPGTYEGFCAEFCGEQHANMRFKVIAQSQADFDAWVVNQNQPAAAPASDLEQQGFKLVAEGTCVGCHTINGTNARGLIGPNLTKLYTRTTIAGGALTLTDENLRLWLQHSDQVKPRNLMAPIKVTDQQIEAVMAYLKTLK